jgi:hypothetical protein
MQHSDSNDSEYPTTESTTQTNSTSFSQLASANRLGILNSLALAATPVAYVELFEQTSIDDRGQFNYHLRQLRDEFVQITEEEYKLSQTGLWVLNILSSDILNNSIERPFCKIDSVCGNCPLSGV